MDSKRTVQIDTESEKRPKAAVQWFRVCERQRTAQFQKHVELGVRV